MRVVQGIAACFVLFGLALIEPNAAPAQRAQTSRIKIAYVPPKNPEHQPIYERLKEARALEKLQQILSPFRLPRPLTVKVEGCDGDINAWYSDDAITVCYEYLAWMVSNVPKETTPAGITPTDALLGPLFDVFLHEFGHALFDVFDVPLFGREEDAADQVSAYIMLQFGKEESRRLILGTAYGYKAEVETSNAPVAMTAFADEHGTPAQRFYNILCVAYGADAKLFADVVEKEYLPKNRAEGCEDEYEQVDKAFKRLIAPHIDRKLARKVHDKSWLPDPSTQLPQRTGSKRTNQAK
jgi:hypothetical protein